MQYDHQELVWIAARQLKRWRCDPVFQELVTNNSSGEIPDAIGWTPRHSILFECKTSRNDLRRDTKKLFRWNIPEYGMGDWRFYLCPDTVQVTEDDIPPGWGVYVVTAAGRFRHLCGRKYVPTGAGPFPVCNIRAEMQLFRSQCRRYAEEIHKLKDQIKESR